MNIAKVTSHPSTLAAHQLDESRPIMSRSAEMGPTHQTKVHHHPRAQLIYGIKGVLRVETVEGTWIVPPTQAVWVPSNVVHRTIALQGVSVRNLFIDPTATVGLPDKVSVFNVPLLLRELILKAMSIGNDYQKESSGYRIMQVILDLLQELKPAELHLLMGHDLRLKRVMDTLNQNHSDARTLEEWASLVGASARTLARLFIKETGMSFREWRQQLYLLTAIERLGQGQSVTRVAIDLGYNSTSAFIAMFRKKLGKPPAAYFRDISEN